MITLWFLIKFIKFVFLLMKLGTLFVIFSVAIVWVGVFILISVIIKTLLGIGKK